MVQRTQRFGAQWSIMVRMVTALVIVMTVVAVGVLLREAGASGRDWLVPIAFIPAGILCIAVAYAPLGYAVDSIGIIVHRMGPNVCIRHEEIAETRPINAREVGLGIRMFGSGGFFGFFGWFYSRRLGWFRAYATNRRDLVLLSLHAGGKVVLSPYPADAFVECVQGVRG